MLKIFSMPWWRDTPDADPIEVTDPMSHPAIARMDLAMLADLPAAALHERGTDGEPADRLRVPDPRAGPCGRLRATPWGLSEACV